jgi:hypothetical protein
VPAELPFFCEIPLFVLLEREVEEEFRPLMLQSLQQKVDAFEESIRSKERPTCSCSKSMTCKDARAVSWNCRWGKIVARPVRYQCKACKRYRRPLLEALGVEVGRLTGSFARMLALLGCVVPYEQAAQLAGELLGVQVNAMTVWRAVQRLGEASKRYEGAVSGYYADCRNDAEEPENPPRTVVVAVDGAQLGMQVRTHRRRRKNAEEKLAPLGKVEDKGFREVKTAVLLLPSERMESSPGRRSVLRRVLVTYLGQADEVFDRLWARLQVMGWVGMDTIVVVVGDAADWIWNRAAWFANRCEILDFWHAIEHAWEVARLPYGENSKEAARWVRRISTDLRAGRVQKVIARLKKIAPATPEAQERLESLIRYYANNAHRMCYDEYLRAGYGIGSGAVESAHKQLVQARMRQAGMRWSEVGAQRLLALRVMLLNGDWTQVDHLRMVA